MIIEYYIKNVYGNELRYAANEEQAAALRMMSNGYQTISDGMVEGLELLGFELIQILPPQNKK